MAQLNQTEAINCELLNLSMHSHDVRNRVATIKSSAELLLQEPLQPGQRELVALIQERAWSALDLSSNFTLERTLKAGLYRPFKKEHALSYLIRAALTTLREACGPRVTFWDPPKSRTLRHFIQWRGDENLFLLLMRNAGRILASARGPSPIRLTLELRKNSLRWNLDIQNEQPGEIPLGDLFLQQRIFATALGGRLARLPSGKGVVLSIKDLTIESRERRPIEAPSPSLGR